MKYIAMSVFAIVILAGCVGEPRPRPQPVVKKVEKPKPAPVKHYKKGEVPPLPEREVDVDLDNVVDQAAAEVLKDDNAAQALPQ